MPPSFASEPHLVLQYGRNMPIPIPDLEVTDEGVSATLSFSRAPHRTHVPWSSVYVVACTDGRGILYYEDVPQEVSLMAPPGAAAGRPAVAAAAPSEAVAPNAATAADAEGGDEGPQDVRRLRSVPAEVDNEQGTPSEVEAPVATKRRRRPQLRLVK